MTRHGRDSRSSRQGEMPMILSPHTPGRPVAVLDDRLLSGRKTSRRLNKGFIARVEATKPLDMWYPTREELVSAHVQTTAW